MFVGSAGAYAANDIEPMHVEGDKRKSSAGRSLLEQRAGFRSLNEGLCKPKTHLRQSQSVLVAPAGRRALACCKCLTLLRLPCLLRLLCLPSGHVAVEHYLEGQGLPYTVFQPLYIYGPATAKDCEQWFMDRILRSVLGANPGQPARSTGDHCSPGCDLPLLLPPYNALPGWEACVGTASGIKK